MSEQNGRHKFEALITVVIVAPELIGWDGLGMGRL